MRLLGLVLAFLLLTATPAGAGLLDLINAERVERDRPALIHNAALDRPARKHARWMMEHGIYHDTSALVRALNEHAPTWTLAGENLGLGPSIRAVMDAWMDSPAHRRNLLRGRFSRVGLGVVRRDDERWVVLWLYDTREGA